MAASRKCGTQHTCELTLGKAMNWRRVDSSAALVVSVWAGAAAAGAWKLCVRPRKVRGPGSDDSSATSSDTSHTFTSPSLHDVYTSEPLQATLSTMPGCSTTWIRMHVCESHSRSVRSAEPEHTMGGCCPSGASPAQDRHNTSS